MIVPESGTTKRTYLVPLYHPDTLVNPDTYIVAIAQKIINFPFTVSIITLIAGSRSPLLSFFSAILNHTHLLSALHCVAVNVVSHMTLLPNSCIFVLQINKTIPPVSMRPAAVVSQAL